MLFSVSVVTVGDSESQLDPVTDVVRRFVEADLPHEVNGMSTVVEGDWSAVMGVLGEAARDLRHEHDRVFWSITIDDHRHASNRLRAAVAEVQQRVGQTGV
jgi:uncharacterized protein YqgV (UPF0045/DUF77 family)